MSANSFVVFPFLKTHDSVEIGRVIFRSTEDVSDLTTEDQLHVRQIARMLFVQDDYRIRSASYATVPTINLDVTAPATCELENLRAVVAYIYASPHEIFGDLFLSSEHASMIVFTPGMISEFMVRPEYHVEAAVPIVQLHADSRHEVPGFVGFYNFRHHFWVTDGSRIYGPKPHLTLNHSQDLAAQILQASADRVDYRLLLALLRRDESETSQRVFTALRWFNAANDDSNDDPAAILHLAVAFEALLTLPADEKTDRFVESVALLVGRVPRVAEWAKQFYAVRSQVVHTGRAEQLRFVTGDRRKTDQQTSVYGPLLSYGRQIFQLCLGALLTGADLAGRAGLEEKLVTNHERFINICTALDKRGLDAAGRLSGIMPLVRTAERYRFVWESGMKLETLIGAVRLAAKALLESGEVISQAVTDALNGVVNSQRTPDHVLELGSIEALEARLKTEASSIGQDSLASVARDLVSVVWGYLFMHYYWLKQRNRPTTPGSP